MNTPTDSRTRIIDAATELFYQKGFEAAGLQLICKQAAVSKSSFYHFFPSKDDLAITVIDSRWLQARQGYQALLDSPLSALEKIEASFEMLFSHAESIADRGGEMYGCPFGNIGSELSTSNPAVREHLITIFNELIATYRQLIEQAQAQGSLAAALNSQESAESLVTLMQGLSIIGKIYNDPARMRRSGEYALQLLLKNSFNQCLEP
ncbi:MAG: TetR/AcrR family transcriptional regulator [Mariprofundus sp.]|nr:TetR/AcrR family transcriptional regulator [Mariprofundus sp.]